MAPLTVAVSGLSATDNPAPGVAVIRAIRAAAGRDCRVIGLAYDALDPGAYLADLADAVFLMPFPSQGAEAVAERLEAIHRRLPIDVLLPCLDSELPALLAQRGRLEALGIRALLPSREALARRAKANLHQLHELGVSVPRGAVLNDVADVARLEGALEPPVVVKGQFYEATVARTLAEVEGAFLRLQAKWGVPVIVQEFVSGGEFDVAAVTGEGGALVGAVAMRKMQLTAQGKAWGGVTIADPAIDAFCRDVLERIEWTGPCELEVIRDPHDGRLTLMEINPRFPAWIYLSVGAGRNLPWAAVRLALGEDVAPLPPAPPGVMFLRHSSDEVCALEDYEQLTTAGELIRDRGTS